MMCELHAQTLRTLFTQSAEYYPADPDEIPAFERLATDVIPALRSP